MRKERLVLLSVLLVVLSLPSFENAYAQEFRDSYDDWSVYTTYQDGKSLCYMLSFPKRKTGNYNYRDDPYAMVTNVQGRRDELSVTGGYKYKEGTEPRVIIDGREYKLSMTEGEFAWFKTSKYDNIAVDKMKKGATMKVKGTSIKGTYSIDTYSLKGFTSAYNKMRRLCKSR